MDMCRHALRNSLLVFPTFFQRVEQYDQYVIREEEVCLLFVAAEVGHGYNL